LSLKIAWANYLRPRGANSPRGPSSRA